MKYSYFAVYEYLQKENPEPDWITHNQIIPDLQLYRAYNRRYADEPFGILRVPEEEYLNFFAQADVDANGFAELNWNEAEFETNMLITELPLLDYRNFMKKKDSAPKRAPRQNPRGRRCY